jgi:hypothetical protein
LLALAASGCSFVFVRPSAVKPLDAADCTGDYAWPVVDAVASAAAVAATVYSAQRSYEVPPPNSLELDREDAVIGYGFAAAFFGGSAVAGFSRVHACREARSVQGPPKLGVELLERRPRRAFLEAVDPIGRHVGVAK